MAFKDSSLKIKAKILPVLIIILMWGIFIFPSSFFPYWSYLDDPSLLNAGKKLQADLGILLPDSSSGRYFPGFMLYYGILFKFFEFNLSGYYVIQCFMFLAILILIYLIVKKITGSTAGGVFAVFLAITASPVAENVYTLGKAENKILFYFIFVIFLFVWLAYNYNNMRKFIRLISWIGITLLLLLAILTKETASIILLFAFAGAVISFLLMRKCVLKNEEITKFFLLLLISSGISFILARGLYFGLRPSNAISVYTSYPITLTLFINNLKFYITQQIDVFLLGLIVSILIGVLYKEKDSLNARSFVFASAFFLTGLAYIIGQLIWRWPLGYYLLLPSAFFSIAAGVIYGHLGGSARFKKIIYVSVIILLMTRIYSIPYSYYIAYAQKAQDIVYTDAIENYIQRAKSGERLLVEQWPFFVEPITQSNILIKEIFRKKQLQVEGVEDIIENITVTPEVLKLYFVSKIPDKSGRLARENDYILTLNGNRQTHWVLRGVSPFLNEKESAFKTNGMKLEKIVDREIRWDGLQIGFPLMIPKFKEYSAGYKLYKVKDPASVILWEGKWSDNWINNIAKCSFWVQKEKEKFLFTGVITEHTIPSSLYLLQDNNIIKEIILGKSGPFSFTLEISSAKKGEHVIIELVTEKTFNPKTLGINNDGRNLSIQIAVQRTSDSVL